MGDVTCQLCNGERESIIHLLRDCPCAKAFWESSRAPNFVQNLFSLDLPTWLKINADNKSIWHDFLPWNIFFAFTVWHLWTHKNKVIFENKPLTSNFKRVVQAAANEFLFYASRTTMLKRKQILQVRWSKPKSR